MLNKKVFLFFLPLCLVSCNINDSSNLSSIIEDISSADISSFSTPSNSNEQIDGGIIRYQQAFSTIKAARDAVGQFIQSPNENTIFYTLDETKIENVLEIKYEIDGFFHLQRQEYFSLQTLKTSIVIKDEENTVSISIVSNGSKNIEETSLIAENGKYFISNGDTKVAEVVTSFSQSELESILNSTEVYLATKN